MYLYSKFSKYSELLLAMEMFQFASLESAKSIRTTLCLSCILVQKYLHHEITLSHIEIVSVDAYQCPFRDYKTYKLFLKLFLESQKITMSLNYFQVFYSDMIPSLRYETPLEVMSVDFLISHLGL